MQENQKNVFSGLREQGFPFVPFDQIKGKITPAHNAEQIQRLIGMKDCGYPSDLRGEAGGSTQAVIEYPNTYASLIYKPNWQEFEIMLADKQGEALNPVSIPLMIEGVVRVDPEELGGMLETISLMPVNRGRGDIRRF